MIISYFEPEEIAFSTKIVLHVKEDIPGSIAEETIHARSKKIIKVKTYSSKKLKFSC